MAKDRKKLLHIHSSIPDKQPTAASLEVGEIAVNNAANQEFLSLKNSNNKVVRFSSDEQIVTIMEKKEVMPYDGYVRGETGPSGIEDGYGSYGITENDLLNNTSNIVIKLNQVAASNTVKHDEVNGAKDKYDKYVNPTSDSGLTDGAGFYIDMSRYAMQGANPTFSGVTTTCYANLNGTTTIKGTDGACGSKLDINVNAVGVTANTWTEGVNTKTENITSRTTTVGTENLTVNNGTTEVHGGAVTITNNTGKTETTKGNNIVNNNVNYNVNTTGNTTVTTTGTTQIKSTQNVCVMSNADANFGGDVNTRIGANCDGTTGYSNNTYVTASSSAFTYAPTVINSGTTNNNTFTTINNSAATINNSATTENNKITTINTTATTINTTATTINQSGDSYNVTANTETHNTTAFTVNSTSAACIVSDNTAGIGGDIATNVGANCQGGAISNATNIYGDTLVESGTTNNNTFTTINNTATTENNNITTINNNTTTYNITGETNIEGDANITGDTYIDGDLTVTREICPTNGLCKTLTWTYGSVCNEASGSTNFKNNQSFVIPKTISDVTCGDVVDENPGTTSGCLTIGKDVCVTGKVTATNGFFQSSDRNLKENIERPNFDKFMAANRTAVKKFNYKNDETKRDTYGVIAQEAEANGLEEVIYTDENGNKAVDYTSLLMLKIGFLENEIKLLRYRLSKLDGLN